MTYNVFDGTLNLTELQLSLAIPPWVGTAVQ